MPYKIGKNRIEYEENGKMLAEVDFPDEYLDNVCIIHTYVDKSLRGQGVAAKLLELTAEELRKTKRKAVPKCSYAVKWFEEHPEQADILK